MRPGSIIQGSCAKLQSNAFGLGKTAKSLGMELVNSICFTMITDESPLAEKCSVCGARSFTLKQVLWPELIEEWELNAYQRNYINAQQGYCCKQCSSNLRSIILAKAIMNEYGKEEIFVSWAKSEFANSIDVLEVNEAGSLHPHLAKLSNHTYAPFPEHDLQNLNFQDGKFDLVVHSDTLEHIEDPKRALMETLRVLRKGGKSIFTTPIVVEKTTRSREFLANSYHGDKNTNMNDWLVRYEFGMDVWTLFFSAGFSIVKLYALAYPIALAVVCEK